MGKGWLDNYNDSKVSVPEGFQGEGYSMKGRNYSPAWGGQFQMGGEVPKRRGVRQNPDGTVSTHLMATETDGKGNWFSFPTLFQNSIPYADDSENWVDMSDRPWKEAYEEAKKRGEVINFGKDKDAAIKFGQGSWKQKMQIGENVSDEDYNMKRALELGYTADESGHWSSVDDETGEWLKSKKHHTRGMELMAYELNPELRNKYNLIENEKGKLQYVPKLQKIEEYQMGGNIYPVNYVPQAQMGASIPGSVGFTYARTNNSAPSNGKYAKKTMASAQNGITKESTSIGRDRIPISSKDIIKTIPGTNIHIDSNGKIVIKDKKGVYKPVEKQKQPTISQGRKKTSTQIAKEDKIIEEMQSNNLGLRAPLHYLANPDHMLGDFGNLTGFKPLQTFSNSDEDAQRYNFKSLDPSKSRSKRFEDSLNEGLGLLPEASFNLALASLATKTPISALKEAYNPIPIPFNTGMKYDPTDYWKTAENNSDAVGLMESNNLIADYFPRRDINNVIGYNKLSETLPKEMEPYISKRMLNDTREQEIFESSFPVELQQLIREKRTQYLDNKGNVINNNYTRKDLSNDSEVKYEYFNDLNDKVATFSGKKTPEGIFVNGIEVNPNFRRQGVASNIYRNIAKELQQNNQGSLMSRSTQHQFTDKDELGRSIAPANKLWENLVNKGEAEKFVEGMSHIYKLKPLKQGGVIKDDLGQWAHPGEITEINSNDITMQGVPYPVLGISDTGDTKLMQPGKDYKFKGKKVTEYPLAKDGKELVKLNQLTNFTNYNTKQPGGWLDKY